MPNSSLQYVSDSSTSVQGSSAIAALANLLLAESSAVFSVLTAVAWLQQQNPKNRFDMLCVQHYAIHLISAAAASCCDKQCNTMQCSASSPL
jgi:hypothetical protein